MEIKTGDLIVQKTLESIQGDTLAIPPPKGVMHIQFRRFAGCPICNLHLHAFINRHSELAKLNITEVAVFHSSKSAMLEQQLQAPFPIIADPELVLYREFGVETSIMSVLNPKAWPSAIGGLIKIGPGFPSRGESALGLPADFLLDSTGKVLALKYGLHADDHWSFDEVIALARSSQSKLNLEKTL